MTPREILRAGEAAANNFGDTPLAIADRDLLDATASAIYAHATVVAELTRPPGFDNLEQRARWSYERAALLVEVRGKIARGEYESSIFVPGAAT